MARFAYFDLAWKISLISAEGAYSNHFADSVSLNNCTGLAMGDAAMGIYPKAHLSINALMGDAWSDLQMAQTLQTLQTQNRQDLI